MLYWKRPLHGKKNVVHSYLDVTTDKAVAFFTRPYPVYRPMNLRIGRNLKWFSLTSGLGYCSAFWELRYHLKS